MDKVLNVTIGLLDYALRAFGLYQLGISEKGSTSVITSRKVPTLGQSDALFGTFFIMIKRADGEEVT